MAVSELEDALENTLLLLGRKERVLLDTLKELRTAAREAVRNGKLDVADDAMTKYESLRDRHTALQTEIIQVERRLYGMRRRQS